MPDYEDLLNESPDDGRLACPVLADEGPGGSLATSHRDVTILVGSRRFAKGG